MEVCTWPLRFKDEVRKQTYGAYVFKDQRCSIWMGGMKYGDMKVTTTDIGSDILLQGNIPFEQQVMSAEGGSTWILSF